MPALSLSSRWRGRGWRVGGLAVALVATLGVAAPTVAVPPAAVPPVALSASPLAGSPAAEPAATPEALVAAFGEDPRPREQPADEQPSAAGATAGAATGEGPVFTLLTGDVVRLLTGPDGELGGEVVQDAGLPDDVRFTQIGDELYALTGEVVRLIGEGKLDMELFNLTKLAEYGYDDASVDAIPVITTHDEKTAARRGPLPVPDGAERTAELESIDAQALNVAKDEAAEAWDDLTAASAGVEKVWLDEVVHAALDETVPAVGAPGAWDAGLDGTGTKIVVLDTGIDLTHPDVGAVDELTYKIADADGGTDTASLRVAVIPDLPEPEQPAAPAAVDDVAVTRQDTPVTVPVLANDVGEDLRIVYDGWQHFVGYQEHGTLTVNDDQTVTYTPDEGFVGTDELLYVVTVPDRLGIYDRIEQLGRVRVTVGAAEGPIAVDDVVTTRLGTAVSVTVAGNDVGDGVQVTEVTEAPENGTAAVEGTDTITYIPNADFQPPVAESFVPGETVRDGDGHGTHVASIATGSGAASDGRYRGVAPGAELVVGKVLSDDGGGQVSWLLEGMEWAGAQGADVVNLSLSGGPDSGEHPMSRALNEISDATGTLFVVAAGNEGGVSTKWPSSVAWPGSADRALTVGNVATAAPHGVDISSSVGPLLGSHGIKPEITAPGMDVMAACAVGSACIREYQAMSGTSMATPHVVGAAAILAQQHPDWTRDQLKDALISTADPNATDPVTFQGGGMLDVDGVTTSPIVATGTLHLGRIEAPHPETVTGEITLRNVSDQPVTADLDLELRRLAENLRTDEPSTPADGAVTITPSSATIPAGGTATVTLTVRPETFDLPSSYYGWLRTSIDGETVARTTVGWTKDHELHQLTVRGTDRAGKPANTTGYSWLYLIDRESGRVIPGWWVSGTAHFEGFGPDPHLPEGRYILAANMSDWTQQAPSFRLAETMLSEPELVMDRDISLTYDAREANRVEFRTPRPSVPLEPNRAYTTGQRWYDETGHLAFNEGGVSPPEVYLLPSQLSDPARPESGLGEFETWVKGHHIPENLTMTTRGSDSLTLNPEPPTASGPAVPFENGAYELVDAGAGTTEELAAADVEGRLVLIDEVPNPGDYPGRFQAEKVAQALEAGAAGVLYAVADPGPPNRDWGGAAMQIPVAVVTRAEEDQLTAALDRAGGPLPLQVSAEAQASYLYALYHGFEERVTDDTVLELTEDDFAAVETLYHADQPGTSYWVLLRHSGSIIAPQSEYITAPFTRTEYLIGGEPYHLTAQDSLRPFNAEGEQGNRLDDDGRPYAAGTTAVEHIWSPPVVPGINDFVAHNSFGHSLRLFSKIVATGNRYFAEERFGGGGTGAPWGALAPWRLTYSAGGQQICQTSSDTPADWWPYCRPSQGDGRYEIELESGLGAFPGTGRTRTVWNVDVEFPGDHQEAFPPVVDLRYDVGMSLLNTVRSGSRYPLTVDVAYQRQYEGDGEFTITVWASHDDGETWNRIGVQEGGEDDQAKFWIRTPPRGAEHTSVRVVAEDADGNSVDQTLIRAWKVAPLGRD